MTRIFRGRYGDTKGFPRAGRCAASVHDVGSMSVGFHQCTRRIKVNRKVDGKSYGFCKLHDPIAVEARHKKRDEKWDAEFKRKEAQWAYADKIAIANRIAKKVLKAIAEGHNDARGLAKRALAKYPKEIS